MRHVVSFILVEQNITTYYVLDVYCFSETDTRVAFAKLLNLLDEDPK